jgi:release factor glutamine methyltransferase
VLCPRPDTETLVEAALEWIGSPAEPVYVADVGCGSGAVGLAIAAACEQVRVYAIDVDRTALDLTLANVKRLGLEKRVAVLEGDLLSPVPPHRPIDWVVSNPPYVPTGDIDALEPEVSRWEPRRALDGGRDGLDVVRRLVPLAARRARAGVLLEIGVHQAAPALQVLARAGLVEGRAWTDLGGVHRVVGARVSRA